MDESISLRELVDVDIIQSIQDRFAKSVGVSSVIFLPNGDALTRFSNSTKFCSLIRSTKEGRRRCFQSFTEMSRKATKLNEPEIMYCFAYGAHFVAPIIIDGERKATMYAGQFRPEKFSPEQLKELEKIAVEIDLDPELLTIEAKNMRTVKDKVVWACLHSFFRTVKVIAELGAQAAELRQTKDALQNAHDELEIRVRERTAELTEANKELRREIAERKSAEDALRESEGKLRSIVEQSGDGVVLADEEGTIIEWNRGQERIIGLSRAEVLGRPLWDVMAHLAANEQNNPALQEQIKSGVLKILETGQAEWLDRLEERVVRRPDGTHRVIQVAVFPIETGKGFMTGAISRDTTERKAAEEQIKRSLREKDVLMQEIYHRVKNNLQVVSSLLSMQARTTRNKEAIDVLSKSQSRINTMALIHTQLYESGDLSELNMKEFVGTLSEQLFRSYQVNDTKIARSVHVTDHKFPVSVGVHVGLIINELLSNALQHAFGEGDEGKIEVSLTAPDSGMANLRVSDDGVGLPPGFDINATKTLGLHLVKILVEDQLQGTLKVINDGGTTFNMEFDISGNGGSSYGEDKNTDR